MSHHFTLEEIEILKDVATEESDDVVESRNGIAQSRYVFEVPSGVYYDYKSDKERPIPKNLMGFWMMTGSCDTDENQLSDCFEREAWCKCEKLPVTTYDWVEINT